MAYSNDHLGYPTISPTPLTDHMILEQLLNELIVIFLHTLTASSLSLVYLQDKYVLLKVPKLAYVLKNNYNNYNNDCQPAAPVAIIITNSCSCHKSSPFICEMRHFLKYDIL